MAKLTALAVLFTLFFMNDAFALTEARYQFTDGKEVVFFETVAENPNISTIQKAFTDHGYNNGLENVMDTVNQDVWCRIETHTESPILRLECYQPHGGHGFSVHNDYNPSAKGYAGILVEISKLRQELRAVLNQR